MECTQKHLGKQRAFTIVELLVVILIGLIILTIAVPAFTAMIYSSNRSLAVNALQASSQMARDVALTTGRDGAVVFVFDPQVGKMQIIPAVKVGTIRETTTAPNGPGNAMGFGDLPYFDRDVFVPAAIGETLEMPRYWMVRGYAPPRSLVEQDSAGNFAATWFNSLVYGGTNPDSITKISDHWVFPETGFFPVDAQVAGGGLNGGLDAVNGSLPTARQSFIIRFNARTGVVSREMNSALFINLRNSRERPYGDRPTQYEQTLRIDMAEDLEVWAERIINAADLTNDGVAYAAPDIALRSQLIGSASNDTILVKPVTRLALYDERKLGVAIGARGLNRDTQTLYLPIGENNPNAPIAFDMSLFTNLSEEEVLTRIDQWVDGDTNFDAFFNLDDEPESRMYLIQSYTGELQEVLR
jgi:prepilin-type N-terminal cleavage/methylation domain-containing protein